MGKKRIYEFAKELNLPSKTVVEAAQKAGLSVKNHMAAIDSTQEQQIRTALKPQNTAAKTPHNTNIASHNTHKNGQHAAHSEQQNHGNQQQSRSQKSVASQPHHSNNQTRQANHRMQSNSAKQNTRSNERNHSSNNRNQSNTNRPQGQQGRPQTTQNNNHSNVNRTQRPSNNQTQGQSTRTQGSTSGTQNRTTNNNNNQSNNRNRNNNNRGGWSNNNNRNQYGNRRRNNKKNRRRDNTPKKPMPQRKDRPLPKVLLYTEGMNAQDLGKILHREPAEIVKKLFMLGVMTNQNQSLGKDAIELLAADYGIDAQEKVEEDISDLDRIFNEESHNQDHLEARPPVVTIMGHVDHGKTTLLDKLRHTHVTEGEAGGITQHIGAYQVKLNNRVITFLDTPGHAAFTNMRARGADVTDIIILVVAADDGVMPQTIEAINHAKAAHAPIIVAVNKIDKPGANPNHVMEQLTEYGLIPESWGGDTIFVEISAKFGKNIDELLEMVLLEADMLELKANPDQKAVGTVLEARLDKGKGPVASLLVQQGTLHVGDPIVVGNTFGRVRVMTNDRGRRVKEALPSEPVEITGLNDVPAAADKFAVYEDEKTARSAGEERAKKALLEERSHTTHVTLDNLFESMKQGELKEVDIIIKGDVQGSVEALANSLQKIDVEGVRVNIIHQAVGAINESDVTLAAASQAIIIGFNVRPTANAKSQADMDNVDIRLYNVIYNAIEEVESAMKGMLEPTYQEKVTGNLQVRETYKVSKVGTIAGAYVNSGYITRDSGIRLIRNGIVIYEGKLASLKRFKDDVKEVRQGFECGLTIENYNDIKVDDEIEAYVMEEVPAK
ncbi:translation initiation factor IF-2 [Lactobacillus sp. CC-MHH1034]|uniref:translation initiation factor IF-2 n=1 Tax=Agrilactobacillus fermenti TaxID=2586909 RepID=UPI001E561EFF|nr:translation initiation factor IF-2 [Agrilactobacillus fermenti]MCD2256262.1 translation initiation factor IF-2 [Agrilactobacillus fermenti]